MYRFLSAFAVVAAVFVTAQDDFTQAISGRPELSNLSTYLNNTPGMRDRFNSARNVTILAPSDENFKDLIAANIEPSEPPANSILIDGILTYHIINGTHRTSDITSRPQFLKTLLDDRNFENVRSGQVVKAVREGDDTKFYSGLLRESKTTADVSGHRSDVEAAC